MTRIETPKATHLYQMTVIAPEGHRAQIEVEANRRDQAANMARRAGYEVLDVNMTG